MKLNTNTIFMANIDYLKNKYQMTDEDVALLEDTAKMLYIQGQTDGAQAIANIVADL